MQTILNLRDQRLQKWEAAKAFLASKRGTDGLVSVENTEIYDKMESEVASLGKEIDRLERQRDMDMVLNSSSGTPIHNQAPTTGGITDSYSATGRESDAYKTAFWNVLRGKKVSNALQEDTDSEGGYLVPDQFEKTLVEGLLEENLIRRIARTIPVSTKTTEVPVLASRGTAAWVAEEALIPDSDVAFSQITLNASKVATLIKVSDELLSDSVFPLESFVASEFARRIGDKEEEAFFTGNGVNKPTGILAATGGAPVGVTAASQITVTLDEVMDLYYSISTAYRNRAVFVANDATVKALRKLKATDGQYLWQPSIKDGTPDMLLGRPIYSSSKVPVMAAGNKAIVFGDFNYYWIADRQGRSFQRLNELYAANGQRGFLAIQRVDGKMVLSEAFSVLQMAAGS